MTLTVLRRYSVAAGLLGALALVAACSGTMTPNSPSTLGSSIGPAFTTSDPCSLAATATGTEEPPPECNLDGRFTGGGFQINFNDIKVTRGFTLHCDAMLSNNFEVNWAGGNNFHIDKNPTDVLCSLIDDPNPPDAPVNRIDINGTGTLNGTPGATVTLVLVDNGEKNGAPPDRAYIEINGVALTNGSVEFPAPIDGGNIQAHFDQPHNN